MKKSILSILAVLFAASILLAGCNKSTSIATKEVPSPALVTMTLAAAASLEDVLENELIPLFVAQNPQVSIEGTYDSSGKLQTQIEEGLSASVFFSAATKQMDALVEAGRIDKASVVPLLENEVVLISPKGSDLGITSFEDIVKAKSIAMGDPESVPAGQYAKEILTGLGVWEAVQSKISLASNVTEVLNQVAEGSADVGIVYATDAAQMPDKVQVLATAPKGSLAKKVLYPIGILADAAERETAELFVAFLQTPEALVIFAKKGFNTDIT